MQERAGGIGMGLSERRTAVAFQGIQLLRSGSSNSTRWCDGALISVAGILTGGLKPFILLAPEMSLSVQLVINLASFEQQ